MQAFLIFLQNKQTTLRKPNEFWIKGKKDQLGDWNCKKNRKLQKKYIHNQLQFEFLRFSENILEFKKKHFKIVGVSQEYVCQCESTILL